jgi:hypothetical protein
MNSYLTIVQALTSLERVIMPHSRLRIGECNTRRGIPEEYANYVPFTKSGADTRNKRLWSNQNDTTVSDRDKAPLTFHIILLQFINSLDLKLERPMEYS